MKRLWRWLFRIAAGVSLVLCIATIVLWVRGYWKTDYLTFVYDVHVFSIENSVGTIEFIFQIGQAGGFHRATELSVGTLNTPPPSDWLGLKPSADWRFAGIWHNQFPANTNQMHVVGIACWHVLVLALILPMFCLWHFMRNHRRHIGGLCLVCGYDLRATPERCPECGTIPTPTPGATT